MYNQINDIVNIILMKGPQPSVSIEILTIPFAR
jgi:hypothetical protein